MLNLMMEQTPITVTSRPRKGHSFLAARIFNEWPHSIGVQLLPLLET